MKILVILISVFTLTLSANSFGGIQVFQTTDNTGLNKQERLDAIDKYLVGLSASIKNMEARLDENTKKIHEFDEVAKLIKGVDIKQASEKNQGSSGKDLNEIDKIKNDILSLKNNDIEKIKINVQELTETIKAIQATIKSHNY